MNISVMRRSREPHSTKMKMEKWVRMTQQKMVKLATETRKGKLERSAMQGTKARLKKRKMKMPNLRKKMRSKPKNQRF